MRDKSAAARICLILALLPNGLSAQESRRLVEFEFRPSDPVAIGVLAEVGARADVTLQAGDSVRSLIERRCGLVDPAYLAAFLRVNTKDGVSPSAQDLEISSPGKVFTFPYCVRPSVFPRSAGREALAAQFEAMKLPLDANALHKAFTDQGEVATRSLASLRLFGDEANTGSDRGFRATEMAGFFFRNNRDLRLSKLQPTDELFFVADTTTVTVPIGPQTEYWAALEALRETGGRTNADPELASLIGNVDSERVAEECKGSDQASWPISPADIEQAMQDIRSVRTVPPRGVPTIMLIDTGYDQRLGTPAIHTDELGLLRGSDVEALPRYVGINTVEPESYDATPPENYAPRMHGSEVAATLLGGRFIGDEPLGVLYPKVTFASIAETDPTGRAFLNVEAIRRAYVLATKNTDVRIVNASVAATTGIDLFQQLLSSQQDLLLVSAAGNTETPPQDFTGNIKWPGVLGGSGSPVVVSVGAHGPTGKLLYFSRKGEQVDLLAPGCFIPTYSLENGKAVPVLRSGTSYAAPIVSLIASILSHEGLTALQIKTRFLISADVNERIANDTYSGGKLSVTKALSIYHDYVEYEEIEPGKGLVLKVVKGELQSLSKRIELCERQIVQLKDLRKLVRSIDPDNPRGPSNWRGWIRVSASDPKKIAVGPLKRCRVDEFVIAGDPLVIKSIDGRNVTVPLANLRDFVAAIR